MLLRSATSAQLRATFIAQLRATQPFGTRALGLRLYYSNACRVFSLVSGGRAGPPSQREAPRSLLKPLNNCWLGFKTASSLPCNPRRVTSVAFNPFHDQLLVSGGSDGRAALWRVSSISSAPLLELGDEDIDPDTGA